MNERQYFRPASTHELSSIRGDAPTHHNAARLLTMLAKVLISGSSGPIGKATLSRLQKGGYAVTRLVRHASRQADEIQWDPMRAVDIASVTGFDAVIHLAGESIVGRWNDAKKAAIRESRVAGTRNLTEALAKASAKPRVVVCASAIGYYGDRGDELLREEAAPGRGFLAEVCEQLEAASLPAVNAGIRVVHLRIGLVLSPSGGALAAMKTPFKMGVGGRIGSGKQWWSWIDVRDLADAFVFAMENESVRGPVNAVSPNAVTNAQFTRALGKALSRPAIFPLPAFAARLALGEMANDLLLASERVEPARLVAAKFPFRYPELAASLRANLEN
ncbi:MAG TPA: TIGR01777 family oxidoreductase [Terriglobales bacterium]